MTDATLAPEGNELPLLLVVIDDSEESSVALNYACARARATASRVALLRVIEPDNFMHWASLREMAEQEAREEERQLICPECKEVIRTVRERAWPGQCVSEPLESGDAAEPACGIGAPSLRPCESGSEPLGRAAAVLHSSSVVAGRVQG